MEIGPPRPDELDELDALLGPALHFSGGTMRSFMDMLGADTYRAVRAGGRIVAGLSAFPTGQWYGGRLVPAWGVTAVGVAPDVRGTGVGTAMLRASLEEQRAAGVPLAVLYPATLRYYRRAGYERAGYRIGYELPLTLIDAAPAPDVELVPLGPEQYPEARRLYEQRARRTSGNLDRPEWLWKIKMEPKDRILFRFLLKRGGQAEGYVVYSQGARDDPITLIDVVTLTPEAGRRVLALVAGYHTMVEQVTWGGGPLDPLLYLLGENLAAGSRSRATVKYSYDWMLRVADVAGALAARGYPPGLSATLELDVADEILPENAGRYVLEVADGRASVSRGGRGRVALGVRELAALYTGFASPQELRSLGSVAGADDDLALLGAVFGGPRPWMADMF